MKLLRSALIISTIMSGLVVQTINSDASPIGLLPGPTYETRLMAGLQWNFGTSTPELVLGTRRTETQSDNSVLGGKFDIVVPLNPATFMKPIVRVMAVGGNRDIQGEFGFATRLIDWKPMLSLGVQGPYSNAGIDLGLDWKIDPFAGFNSLTRPKAARKLRFGPPI